MEGKRMKTKLFIMLAVISGVIIISSVGIWAQEEKLQINFATPEELKSRLDLNAETVQMIIDHRPYGNVGELKEVAGIDDDSYQKILDMMIKGVVQLKVNINAATVNELKSLPDIDQQAAQAIIDNRPYAPGKIEEKLLIARMEGGGIFGEKRYKGIEPLIEAWIPLIINIATLEELQTLPGIQEKTALAILENRPYKTC